MDDVLAFRNAMAESGREYTPAEAAKIMAAAEKFRADIHERARTEPEYFERLANLTLREKRQLRREFAEAGQKMTLAELDRLVQLILDVYEQEKLF